MKKLTVEPTKPQYAFFDWVVSWPVIRLLKPLYEWKRSFWIYCVLGFVSTLVDTILSLIIAKLLPFSATLANGIAWVFSTLISFVLFRYLYFDRTNNTFIKEFLKFVPTRLFTFFLSELAIFVFVDIMDINMLLVKIILIPVTASLNYITSKVFVFKDKKTA